MVFEQTGPPHPSSCNALMLGLILFSLLSPLTYLHSTLNTHIPLPSVPLSLFPVPQNDFLFVQLLDLPKNVVLLCPKQGLAIA